MLAAQFVNLGDLAPVMGRLRQGLVGSGLEGESGLNRLLEVL